MSQQIFEKLWWQPRTEGYERDPLGGSTLALIESGTGGCISTEPVSQREKKERYCWIYIYIWYKSQIYKKYIWMIYVKCISWPTGKKFYNWIYWPVYLWIHTPNWSTVSDRGHQPPGGGADLRHTSEVVGFRVVGGKSTTVAAFCGGFPLAIREMSEVVPQDFFCFGKKFFFFDKWGEKNTFFSYTLRPWFFFKYPFFWVVFPP